MRKNSALGVDSAGKVGEMQRRAHDARERANAAKKEAQDAKQRAREARRLFKEAKQVAKKARNEAAALSKKLKKLVGSERRAKAATKPVRAERKAAPTKTTGGKKTGFKTAEPLNATNTAIEFGIPGSQPPATRRSRSREKPESTTDNGSIEAVGDTTAAEAPAPTSEEAAITSEGPNSAGESVS